MSANRSRIQRGVTALLAVALLCAGARAARANPTVYQKTLLGTGWIVIPVGNNQYDWGTCWVFDRRQKLLVTNYHVVKENTDVVVRFPVWENQQLEVDARVYWQKVKPHKGKVLFTDKGRDLALVRLETIPDHVQQIRMAAQSAMIGETVHSIGNSSVNPKLIDAGALWRYTRGEVRLVRQHVISMAVNDAQITVKGRFLETSSPINHGDSGGPVVNDHGELVGVVSSFDAKARNITWNIDVTEVRAFWEAYRNTPAAVAGGN